MQRPHDPVVVDDEDVVLRDVGEGEPVAVHGEHVLVGVARVVEAPHQVLRHRHVDQRCRVVGGAQGAVRVGEVVARLLAARQWSTKRSEETSDRPTTTAVASAITSRLASSGLGAAAGRGSTVSTAPRTAIVGEGRGQRGDHAELGDVAELQADRRPDHAGAGRPDQGQVGEHEEERQRARPARERR